MTPPATELEAAMRLAIAVLVATGVGLERERSGHATGPHRRFAGLRTFLLLGLLAGAAGLCVALGFTAIGAVMAGAGMVLTIVAFALAHRAKDESLDGTTEAAALAVMAIGVLAGIGWLALAGGAGAIVVLALSEKARLHRLANRVGDDELRAALQFAVLALVVLPLLPEGPFLAPLDIRPRALWIVVLIFSGLNYIGYLVRAAVGTERGHTIAGLLGGLVSSTLVTLDFSRRSRTAPAQGAALAAGVIGACTVLFPRVVILSAALDPGVARALVPVFIIPTLVGAALVAVGWSRNVKHSSEPNAVSRSPLQLWSAIRMAALFQVAIFVLSLARTSWGATGLYGTSALLGLTDVDALTAAVSRPRSGVEPTDAAHAIAIGILANTALKLGVSVSLGKGAFRSRAAIGLVLIGTAVGLGFWLF